MRTVAILAHLAFGDLEIADPDVIDGCGLDHRSPTLADDALQLLRGKGLDPRREDRLGEKSNTRTTRYRVERAGQRPSRRSSVEQSGVVELPESLRRPPEIWVGLARESWDTVVQTLGYANNPAAEIPGIRLEIKDQIEGGRIGGKP